MRISVCLFLWLAQVLWVQAEPASPAVALREVMPGHDTGRMPVATQGAWRDHVQLVWDPVQQSLTRRHYRVFDPFAERDYDLFWQPRDPALDRAGLITGDGIVTWRRPGSFRHAPDGIAAQYIGPMQGGAAHGFGRFTDASGLRYTGGWARGLMQGEGQLQYATGDSLIGQFQRGVPQGAGRLVDVTGASYAGPFADGAPVLAQSGPTGLAIALSVGGGATFCCTFRGQDLNYASLSEPGRLSIFPDDPTLMDQWRGRANVVIPDAVSFDWARAVEGKYSFLNYHESLKTTLPLRFGLRNATTQSAQIIGAFLDISRSQLDAQPMMQAVVLRPLTPLNTDFSLENYGWAVAQNVVLNAHFEGRGLRSAPFTLALQDVSDVSSFSFASVLQQMGVAVDRLNTVATMCAGQNGNNMNPPGCTDQLRQSGVYGDLAQMMTENALASRFGLNVVGRLEYTWTDGDGRHKRTASPFNGHLPLAALNSRAECEGGDFELVDNGNPFDLSVSQDRYRINLPVSGAVQAGEERRWEVLLDVEKSSNHDMRVVIVLADGREVISRDIAATLFTPRSYDASIRPFEPRC